jgi:hypothetical protein
MKDPDTATMIIRLIQSAVSLIAGALALYRNRRLSQELNDKFKTVYGKLFGIEWLFQTSFMLGYFRLGFYILGVAAITFAIFNLIGPIYSW